ncbi:dual specificity protein phosphatase 19 [Daktulosphaira vitifoliae]|uniref:dual specificity protein phosphatase 19 n=1 Tax=Daktulosphaira vitifoliae TaxID=58002 RepID=UPI0021AAD731|nr:dual specificity protein phosphatase 19 [Daktulosphaira vitifoliae]
MSFLEQIKIKKKNLVTVETKVKTENGKVYKELKTSNGVFYQSLLKDEQMCGYIVDTKPDLNVGKVFEFLYFGSQDAAADLSILKSLKISHIISLGVPVPKYKGYIYKSIDIYDLPTFELSSIIKECIQYIEDIHNLGNRVFIHCNAGISRSPSIVIAFVMKYLKMDFNEAFKYVKKTRPNIKPNDGFIVQLKNYNLSGI